MKNKIIYILISIIIVLPISVNAYSNNLSEEFQSELFTAEILEILGRESYESSIIQSLKIEILNGEYKGDTFVITNTITNTENDIKLEPGDKINVVNYGDNEFYFHSYEKSNYLLLLTIIFALLVIFIGKFKGLKALLSLILTILLILFVLVPLLLKGYNPIPLSILICILATVITFGITNGITKKSLIALIGVSGGLIAAGIIIYIFTHLMNLSGMASESEQMLLYLPGDITFDFKGLLFAGIIIGALGACMDVAMELTSSLFEIKAHKPNIEDKDLMKSGFNIGKDIMGTMVNTLILAYTGTSLPTILLFVGFEKNFIEIINLESISIEILRAMSGSIGLLLTIPITILIFIAISKMKVKNEKNTN